MIDETGAPLRSSSHRSPSVLRSFYFAYCGLSYLLRTQRNARIHLLIAAIVCAIAAWLRVGPLQWAILVLTIAMVLILEGVNTAIEAIVDLISPQIHPLARIAKDVSAATVLIAAIAAVIIGGVMLGPPLWEKVAR